MEFKTIQSVKDPHYNEALKLYDTKLNLSLTEDKRIIKRSLENNKTENDYVFIVGLENDVVVSLATAHYEATTNSAFFNLFICKRPTQPWWVNDTNITSNWTWIKLIIKPCSF